MTIRATIRENAPGIAIGAFAANPPGDDPLRHVVDDARFEVVEGMLRLKPASFLDYEAARSVTVTASAIRGTATISETFIITVTDVAEAPTAISLAATAINENAAGGTIGRVTATDPEGGPFTYTVSDSRFVITDGVLKLKPGISLDHEAAASVTLTVTARDAGGLSSSQDFTITVTDVNERPVGVALEAGTVVENVAGAVIGTLSGTDPDEGDSIVYSVADTRFEVVGTTLKLKDGISLNYEQKSAVRLTVVATDEQGLATRQSVDFEVGNVNEAPTAVTLLRSLTATPENVAGAAIGFLGTRDPDRGETFTYSLNDARFTVVDGNKLRLAAGVKLDYEAERRVVLDVTSTDSGGLSRTQAFVLNVADLNEAPTAITIVNQQVVRENAAGAVVGRIAVTDPEGGPMALTVSDARFQIVDGSLRLKDGVSLDYEAAAKVRLRITATDEGGLSRGQNFDISVLNLAEADTMTGGAGNNAYRVDHGGDTVVELPNGGADTVSSSIVSHVLADNVEDLILLTGAVLGTGNAGGNRITGQGAANLIDGRDGADTLIGFAGADTMLGGLGHDSLDGGSDNDDLRGGDGNDTVFGGSGDDLIRSETGFDVMTGGSGRDTFVVVKPSDFDVITDFSVADDTLRLLRSGFASVEEVRAAMTQLGPNVLLTVPGGHVLSFSNRTIEQLQEMRIELGEGTAPAPIVRSYGVAPRAVILEDAMAVAVPTEAGLLLGLDSTLSLAASSIGYRVTDNGGVLIIAASGSFTYTPPTNFHGVDSFSFALLDADGSVGTGTLNLTVTSVHDLPYLRRFFSADAVPVDARGIGFANVIWQGDEAVVTVRTSWGDGSQEEVTVDDPFLLRELRFPFQHSYAGDGEYAMVTTVLAQGEAVDTRLTTVRIGTGNLVGDFGFDALVGGAGADTLRGGAGEDFLRGNGGADVFVIEGGDGAEVIADFDVTEDRLVLMNTARWTREEILASARQTADGLHLDLDYGGASVLLLGLGLEDMADITMQFGVGTGVRALADSYAGFEDTELAVGSRGVLRNDAALDGSTLTARAGTYTTSQGGMVTIQSTGNFRYTGATDFSGSDSFTYLVRDADGSVGSATVALSIAAVPDLPSFGGLTDIGSAGPLNLSFLALLDRGDADAVSATVNWGDGTSSTVPLLAGAMPANTTVPVPFSHAYAASGSYTATLVLRAGATVVSTDTTKVQMAGSAGGAMVGSAGTDLMVGGAGADIITGGEGDDLAIGGGGADIFVFSKAVGAVNAGRNQIDDFTSGVDKIQLLGFGTELNSFADLISRALDLSLGGLSGVGISLDHNPSENSTAAIFLTGVSKTGLAPSDFIFG
jgi:Ca2+-binding RTX toxin-like protein